MTPRNASASPKGRWIARDGRDYALSDMTTEHLENCFMFLEKRLRDVLEFAPSDYEYDSVGAGIYDEDDHDVAELNKAQAHYMRMVEQRRDKMVEIEAELRRRNP